MSTKVKSVKKDIRKGHGKLEGVKNALSRAGNPNARTVENVQKALSRQQLKLDFVLDRLDFHKGQKKELRAKLKALRARLRGGR
jgi:hypothetical protein